LRKYPLSSGIPCIRHKCNLCCIETEMSLTSSDINRILRLGYRLENFAVKVEGEWRLRNIDGKCVFLGDKGCRIYPYRPLGCRLYPLVYDESSGTVRFDEICPYADEFERTDEDVHKLINLLSHLSMERDMKR